ncbi:hypothetical protein [Pararhodobacter aggregans]|uniref:hypothetical protein n=1 Tax=Pararhodobacter aggregans TaxID=404875 RepID=UPI003A9529FD
MSPDAWSSLVNDLMDFMLSLDASIYGRKGLSWLEEPPSCDFEEGAGRDPGELARVRAKLSAGQALSAGDRQALLSALPAPGRPGRPRKNRLALEDRDRRLALCAIAVREVYGLSLYRRDGTRTPDAPRQSACDAVADALKGHVIDGRTRSALGYSTIRLATRKSRIQAEWEWQFLLRNAEAAKARKRAIQKLMASDFEE